MTVLPLSFVPSTPVSVAVPDRSRSTEAVPNAETHMRPLVAAAAQTQETLVLAAELAASKGKHKATVFAGIQQGTSTGACAAELGLALSELGFGTVLVMETDHAHRDTERLLRTRPGVGLLEVLHGTSTLQDAVQHISQSLGSLPYAAANRAAEAGDNAFGGSAFARVLKDACETYDHVLVAAPALEGAVEARLLAAHCGSIVLAARLGQDTVSAVAAAHARFEGTAIQPLGVVLL